MYRIALRTVSPLLIGGQRFAHDADVATAHKWRGGKKQPFIPASAIKGAMRIEFERLMRGAIQDPQFHICAVTDPDSACQAGETPCLACSLFGGAGIRGKLRFADAHLDDASQRRARDLSRTGVSINRKTRTAEPQRLFDLKTTSQGLVFGTTIGVVAALSEEEKQYFGKALDWWAETGLRIGGHRSRGLGWTELRYQEVEEKSHVPPKLQWSGVKERKLYRIRFEPAEPLRISTEKMHSYHLDTLGFIPGSTMAGALAYGLLRAGHGEEVLQSVFADRAFTISHLYCGGLTAIAPATGRECKRNPGHRRHDILLPLFLLKRALASRSRPDAVSELQEHMARCPQAACGASTRPYAPTPQPGKHLYAKLGLSRSLMRAQSGAFYVYEAIAGSERSHDISSVSFEGMLCADEDQVACLSSLKEVLVGGSRSKGFGLGRLSITAHDGSDRRLGLGGVAAVQARVELFNKALRKLAERFHMDDALEERTYFTLDLLTDLVLAPLTSVSQLLEGFPWRWELSVLNWTSVGGYSEERNSKKPLLRALARGGVILLSAAAEETGLAASLAGLEREGLSSKHEQGFGWVQACHRQHYEEVAR